MKDEIKEFEEFRIDEDGTYFYYIDKDGNEQWSYKLDNLKDHITNLQEENKNRISESLVYDLAVARVKELEYRTDKAVEYIENDLKSFLYSIEYKTLLNILNGDDNN